EIERAEEGRLLRLADRVLVEGRVVVEDAGILHRRPGDRTNIGEAAGGRRRRAVVGAGRHGLVEPARLVIEDVLFPERAENAADAPLIRGTQAQLVLLVNVALAGVPGCARREAPGGQGSDVTGTGPVTLVIVGVDAARVVGVVADLVDVAHQVA